MTSCIVFQQSTLPTYLSHALFKADSLQLRLALLSASLLSPTQRRWLTTSTTTDWTFYPQRVRRALCYCGGSGWWRNWISCLLSILKGPKPTECTAWLLNPSYEAQQRMDYHEQSVIGGIYVTLDLSSRSLMTLLVFVAFADVSLLPEWDLFLEPTVFHFSALIFNQQSVNFNTRVPDVADHAHFLPCLSSCSINRSLARKMPHLVVRHSRLTV